MDQKTSYDGIFPRRRGFTRSGLFGKPVSALSSADLQTNRWLLVGRRVSKAV